MNYNNDEFSSEFVRGFHLLKCNFGNWKHLLSKNYNPYWQGMIWSVFFDEMSKPE
jgi:hypothetical protein